MFSNFLLLLVVTAAVELEIVSSRRLALHKAKHFFPGTGHTGEQAQPAGDPAYESEAQGEEADAEESDADDEEEADAEEKSRADESYIQGYIHGYIHGRTDEYADAVAQAQLDEELQQHDNDYPAADSEAAEEATDVVHFEEVFDANATQADLAKVRAALVAAQAPIDNAQAAMAQEAFAADGRYQELMQAVQAMKKARMAATAEQKARAALAVAQPPRNYVPVAMARSDADGRPQEVMASMEAIDQARRVGI